MHGWDVELSGMTVDLLLIIALYMGLASVLAISYIQIPMWLIGAGILPGILVHDVGLFVIVAVTRKVMSQKMIKRVFINSCKIKGGENAF